MRRFERAKLCQKPHSFMKVFESSSRGESTTLLAVHAGIGPLTAGRKVLPQLRFAANALAAASPQTFAFPVGCASAFIEIFFRAPSSVGRFVQLPTRIPRFMWTQRTLRLPPATRGFHLITDQIADAMPEINDVQIGWMQVFIQHTSASLTINENADPDVRVDFETAMNHAVPESLPYVHTLEGPDDMPAHVKASMMGASVMIPISNGRLNLGTWQGIYLCEHRNHAGSRRVVVTINGQVD